MVVSLSFSILCCCRGETVMCLRGPEYHLSSLKATSTVLLAADGRLHTGKTTIDCTTQRSLPFYILIVRYRYHTHTQIELCCVYIFISRSPMKERKNKKKKQCITEEPFGWARRMRAVCCCKGKPYDKFMYIA